jgi:hypothetical protein
VILAWGRCVPTAVSSGAMALPVAPQTVTIYDVVKDLGFPIAVALILLFQVGPKLDAVVASNAQVLAEMTALTAVCSNLAPPREP